MESLEATNDAWYERVECTEPLTQGDILVGCPVLLWKSTTTGPPEKITSLVEAVSMDLIVMTQSCDLMQEKVSDVVLCPTSSLQDYYHGWAGAMHERGQNPSDKAWKSHLRDIADGFLWGFALLNWGEVSGLRTPIRVVWLDRMHTLPLEFLKQHLLTRGEPRLRLRPPYREHLAQAFARLFMRVGLPTRVDLDGPRE